MTINTAGILAVFRVAVRPSLLLPRITIRDIRDLDVQELKKRGVVGLVLDKDNCLTKPRVDSVVPELREAWPALVRAFGRENVLVVSNSAGTRDDAGLLQAESVSRHLGVPVLLHSVKKPGCAKAVLRYFEAALARTADVKGKGKARADEYPPGPVVDIRAEDSISTSNPSPAAHVGQGGEKHILVIGDRVMTDVVLANTMQQLRRRGSRLLFRSSTEPKSPISAIPVLTTTVWKMEGPGSRLMRALEGWSMRRALWYSIWQHGYDPLWDWRDCVKRPLAPPVQEAEAGAVVAKTRSTSPRTATQRVMSLLAFVFRPIWRPVQTRLAKGRIYIDAFAQEARQARYGFHPPEGMSRIRTLRKLVEGDVVRSRAGQGIV